MDMMTHVGQLEEDAAAFLDKRRSPRVLGEKPPGSTGSKTTARYQKCVSHGSCPQNITGMGCKVQQF